MTFRDDFLEAVILADLDTVKRLVEAGLIDTRARDADALGWAVQLGKLEIVKFLLPYSDPKFCDSEALTYAADNSHLEIVELLLPLSDSKNNQYRALRMAIANGNFELAQAMISYYTSELYKKD
jgi:ankyrin repeat protein